MALKSARIVTTRQMISREELRQIPGLHRQIIRDLEQLRFLREKATAVPSTLTDQERVQTSNVSSGNKYVEEAVDLSHVIILKQDRLSDMQERASLFIDTVEDELTRKVLRYRYIKCYTWDDTAELLGYAARYLRRLADDCTKEGLPGPPMSGV